MPILREKDAVGHIKNHLLPKPGFKKGKGVDLPVYVTQVIAQLSLESWFPNRMLRSVFFGK